MIWMVPITSIYHNWILWCTVLWKAGWSWRCKDYSNDKEKQTQIFIKGSLDIFILYLKFIVVDILFIIFECYTLTNFHSAACYTLLLLLRRVVSLIEGSTLISQIPQCTCPISPISEHKCVHFWSEWCIVDCGTGAWWVLWDWSIVASHRHILLKDLRWI